MEKGKEIGSTRTFHPSMEYKPGGARFFADVNRKSIVKIELQDPCSKDLKIFDIISIEVNPVKVPHEYWPYPNCLFKVLSEPDNHLRTNKLREFLLVLGSPGDISENVGLYYTILHFWKFVYFITLIRPTRKTLSTLKYLIKTGLFPCLLRILKRGMDPKFVLKEYNRLVAYRSLEILFAASQAITNLYDDILDQILEDPEYAYDVFYPYVAGEISCMEQAVACQVTSNFSCFPKGVTWLLEHPKLVGQIGKQLWTIYDTFYTCLKQYSDHTIPFVKYSSYSSITVTDRQVYDGQPLIIANLITSLVLICLCNLCAAHPEDEPMERIEPSLLAVVKEGFFDHVGTIGCGILLSFDSYNEVSFEKYLSCLSWSCFQRDSQKIIIDQLHSLPASRHDYPLYYEKDCHSKSQSMLACLMTHTAHLDYEAGSHFCTLAVVYLLKEDEDVAMEVVRAAGDTLFDLSHSIYHAQMPDSNDKPISLKRIIIETMLKFGGSSYFSETGDIVKPSEKTFKAPIPNCVHEAREFCTRYLKEMKMSRYEKQKLVRCADEFKVEGNRFFLKKDYFSAIECYTQALEICPLTCTERRVTYYSNRAECYLKTDQSRRAVRDCTKALAQNPDNLRTRWRRAQAFQNIKKKFPAALDLLTLRRHEDESKKILGERLYKDLEKMIFDLLDGSKFHKSAVRRNGLQVYSGGVPKGFPAVGMNQDHRDTRYKLPLFRGKYFHEIFGYGHGDLSKI